MGRPANLQIRVTSDSQQAQQDIAQAETKISATLNGLKSAGPAIAAAAGLAIGGALVAGIGKALAQTKIKGRLAAQLDATPQEAERLGKLAGQLYSKGITEDFQQAADAISATMRSGLAPPGTTIKQIESIATKAQDLASTFDQETSQITRAVSTMLRTGIAKNADQAFDVLTRGFQNGTNAADDLLDTFSEYSTQFRDLGISADQALGLMSQALQGGARDADSAADALKELNIIIQAKDAADALETLGLNADKMATAFATGGPQAALALDQILDRLRQVEDPAERSRLAVELLGTKSEDLSKALLAMDPSTAIEGLGNLANASDRVGNSLRDNAGAKLDTFKASFETKLVDFIGNSVIPALTELKRWIDEELNPAFVKWARTNDGEVNPTLVSMNDSVKKLSSTIDQNGETWAGLSNFLTRTALPGFLTFITEGIDGMARGISGLIRFLSDLADGFRQLIGWIQDAITWLDRIAARAQSFFSGIGGALGFGSGASFQSQATVMNSLVAAQPMQSPTQTFMRQTFTRPMNLTVVIDGQQLQGRITRTVNSALNYDGARYTAGGWA